MSGARPLIFVLFFASGASGLVYEVVWIRQFGLLFGSTVYSAALVTSLFMAGLGAGGYLAGRWVDRRFGQDPAAPVRTYGLFELGIAGLALLNLLVIPQLAELAANTSAYVTDASGWQRLSTGSSLFRYGCAVVLLSPMTLLMGGTLTLLIRHLVGDDLASVGWHVGALYGINTAGAALGCLLTDTAFVPLLGLRGTQLLAIGLNCFAAVGALWLARRVPRARGVTAPAPEGAAADGGSRVAWAGLAIACSGFAAMAMQILWFRHLISLYGAYRAVFSILLTVILLGIWLGSMLGGALARRTGRPGTICGLALGGFVLWSLAGLWIVQPDRVFVREHVLAEGAGGPLAFYAYLLMETAWVVGPPALLAGTAFPLANALVQRTLQRVGERAGILYLSNTLGGVLGGLLAGFWLLPSFGIQGSATLVVGCVVLAILAISAASRGVEPSARLLRAAALGVVLLAAVGWARLPEGALLLRTLPSAVRTGKEQVIAVREGVNETIAVSEREGIYLRLRTNGHNMSTTGFPTQRYMRAFVHVPMLLADGIENVMLMCFGIGNTANAVLLYPEVKRLDVVDLSSDILEHSPYFEAVNGRPLEDPRVRVHVNDARQHLRRLDGEQYDLITGEPPPISHAGVVNLYTQEFFELAERRLRPGGFVTYWLPMNQVGESVARSIVAAFRQVFPRGVMLSGYKHQLILVGRKDAPIEFDPARMRHRIEQVPSLRRELRWISLDHPVDVAAMLAATPETMERATRGHAPLRDDRPRLEYGSRVLSVDRRLPADLFSVVGVERWCPSCFSGALSPAERAELRGALELIDSYYRSAAFLTHHPGEELPFEPSVSEEGLQAEMQSLYLQQLLGRAPPGYLQAEAEWRRGNTPGAIRTLQAVVRTRPDHVTSRVDLADLYLELGRVGPARKQLETARALAPRDRRVVAAWERLEAADESAALGEVPSGVGQR